MLIYFTDQNSKKGSLIIFFTILIMLKYESIFTSFNFWGKCNLHLNTYSGDPLFGSLQLSRYLSTIGNCDCQPSIAQWKWESILDILWYTARKRKNKTRYKKKILHVRTSLCLEFIVLSHLWFLFCQNIRHRLLKKRKFHNSL